MLDVASKKVNRRVLDFVLDRLILGGFKRNVVLRFREGDVFFGNNFDGFHGNNGLFALGKAANSGAESLGLCCGDRFAKGGRPLDSESRGLHDGPCSSTLGRSAAGVKKGKDRHVVSAKFPSARKGVTHQQFDL